MAQHSATDLRAIAELLEAITKFQSDYSHDLILTGSINVEGILSNGQIQITNDTWHYVTQETKENE
jgi:glucokinase